MIRNQNFKESGKIEHINGQHSTGIYNTKNIVKVPDCVVQRQEINWGNDGMLLRKIDVPLGGKMLLWGGLLRKICDRSRTRPVFAQNPGPKF